MVLVFVVLVLKTFRKSINAHYNLCCNDLYRTVFGDFMNISILQPEQVTRNAITVVLCLDHLIQKLLDSVDTSATVVALIIPLVLIQ